jgi:serine/threonine-protein kinase
MSAPEKIGKYQVEAVLGHGGMGVVYKCYDPAIARSVAVKSITKSELEPEDLKHAIARFRHEARAVGRLMHPRIVQIYDYGEDDDIAYIVMELVNGRTLLDRLKADKNCDLEEGANVILQLLEGIGHAHSQGVVHRDIKPSNIMINEDGEIKIADFGIARTEASSLTQVGDVLGTVYYMSPEQFLGTAVGVSADLYSIGVIAYEMFTGRRPFIGNNAEVMQQMINAIPENPSMLNLRLSPAIDRVLQHALAKDPKGRFQSAEEFSGALLDAIGVTAAIAEVDVDVSMPLPGADESSDASAGANSSASSDAEVSDNNNVLLDAAGLLDTGSVAQSFDNFDDIGAGSEVAGQPLQFPALDTADSAISLDTSIRKARVLFIDDEERILSALKSQFRDQYHVFTTTDGDKALDFISKYGMHVIVSDQRMPNMLGVDLLSRSRDISPNSVRILLTGYSDLAAIVGSINEGEVYRFISKPWDNIELKTVVNEAVTIGLELAKTKSVAADLPKRIDAAVLVLDKNEEIFRVVRELAGSMCTVAYASNVETAIDEMQEQEIAVVVIDVDFGQNQLTSMLKLLKQENPQILSIVVTSASDSELVIDLINQAQIFRFLNKPVSVALMRKHLHSALKRYLAYKKSPELVRTQKVEVVKQDRESDFGKSIVDRFGAIRERWRAKAANAAARQRK